MTYKNVSIQKRVHISAVIVPAMIRLPLSCNQHSQDDRVKTILLLPKLSFRPSRFFFKKVPFVPRSYKHRYSGSNVRVRRIGDATTTIRITSIELLTNRSMGRRASCT